MKKNVWMDLVKKWTSNYITLGFAENGQFTNKKGIEKLS